MLTLAVRAVGLLAAVSSAGVNEDGSALSLLQTSSAKIGTMNSPKQDCKDARKALRDARAALKELREAKKSLCESAKAEKKALKEAREQGRLEKIAAKEAKALLKANEYNLITDPTKIPICNPDGHSFAVGVPERVINTCGAYLKSLDDCYKMCRGEQIMFHHGHGPEIAMGGGAQCAGSIMKTIQMPYDQFEKFGIVHCACHKPLPGKWLLGWTDRVGGGNWMTCAMEQAPLDVIAPEQAQQK